MKSIQKLLFTAIVLLPNLIFSQEFSGPTAQFNGYKYMVISDLDYGAKGKDIYGIRSEIFKYITNRGFQIVDGSNYSLYPSDLKFNNCLGIYLKISHRDWNIDLNFTNCKNELIRNIKGESNRDFENALKAISEKVDNIYYTFDENLTPSIIYPEVENINKSETELKTYYESTKLDPIEGIYKTYKSNGLNLKLAIIKSENEYKAISLEPEASHWKKGDVKVIFENTSVDGVFTVKWYLKNKTVQETFANLEGGLINLDLDNPIKPDEKTTINLLKIFPKN